jgi:non-heme chloroperoxidase
MGSTSSAKTGEQAIPWCSSPAGRCRPTMMLGTSLKALVECSRSMTGTDFRPELSKVRVPALVIHGDRDVSAAIDLTGRPTAKMIPGAVLKVYDGAPHGLFLMHMARLTDDILGFVRA